MVMNIISNNMDYDVCEDEYDFEYEVDEYEYESNDDWNQVKGFRDCTPRGLGKIMARVTLRLWEMEKEERRLKEEKRLEKEEKEKKRIENEEKEKKKIQNYSDSDSDSESDSENECKFRLATKANPVKGHEKFDSSFPTLGQAIVMMNDKDNKGWKQVENKFSAPKNPLEEKKKKDAVLTKTKMCESFTKGTVCRHGKNCRFAHTLDEMVVQPCKYGYECKFVTFTNGFCHISRKGRCDNIHPNEQLENFYVRTGLKKLPPPTEEEMEKAFEEFMKELETPIVEKKEREPKKTEWKKYENVQFVKKVKIPTKPVKLAEEDFEAQKIREKNEISLRIKDINIHIKRSEDTIARFKAMRNITEFYKNQISKMSEEISAKKVEVELLEKKYKEVDLKKKPEKKVITAVIKKIVPVPVKEVKTEPKVTVVAVKKEEPVITLYIPPKKVEPVPVVNAWLARAIQAPCFVPKSPVKKDDDGWIDVKTKKNKTVLPVETPTPAPVVVANRDTGFNILKDKSKIDQALAKTKMCTFGARCTRGKSCRFAHSKSELTVRNCVFGDCCKFVKNIGGNIVNTGKDKICEYKHTGEDIKGYYKRVGL